MSSKVFRFRLKIGSASYVDSSPRWGDEAAFVTEGDNVEMYFREKLNVKLTYQREDFDSIYAAPFETEFRVLLQQGVGGVWQSLWVGKFWYNDVEYDVDNRTCIVSPETFDLFDDLLGGLEKEFNLIELEPPTVTVQMLKQAVIQVYLPGSSFVGNYTNDGIFYETPCTPYQATPDSKGIAPESLDPDGDLEFNDVILREFFGFGTGTTSGLPDYARIVIPGDNIVPDVSGVYECQGYGASDQSGETYIREDGVYRIRSKATSGPDSHIFIIEEIASSTNVYESNGSGTDWYFIGQAPHNNPSVTFNSLTSDSSCQLFAFIPFVRLLTTQIEVDGNPTVLLTDDDPIPHGSFTHALPLDTLNFIFSDDNSVTPTRWGKFDEDMLHFAGDYFSKPTSTEILMPVSGTTWTGASGWFYLDDDLRFLQQQGSETLTIKDAYKLSDVISVLLDEIQPLLAHSDNPTYSQFLYAAGTNPIRGIRKVPIIIPKSNVVVGNYDQPAKKAQIRMSEVRDLLRFFHNVYWHIAEGALIFEHENYYHNGKSYTAENVGTDLTTGSEPKTGQPWAYRTNKFKFDKDSVPERIETNWMDKGSSQFDGYPMQMVSKYAQRGNIEQRQITRFTADVDFIHVAANDISKDGFVFLECIEGGLYYEVPFVEFEISADEKYNMQNGYASLIYAHANYHMHNLPVEEVNLNRADITATTVKRSKVQNITFATEDEIDAYELVETNLGVGRLKKMERPLTSNTVKATIMHNNE
jgi:hypothetical protein